MQGIWTVVGGQLVSLAAVQLELCIFDPVGDTTDRLSEKGRVGVRFRFGETQDDVLTTDFEFLNDGPLW